VDGVSGMQVVAASTMRGPRWWHPLHHLFPNDLNGHDLPGLR